jgi:hypothetical protein
MAFLIRPRRWLIQHEAAVSVNAGIRIATGPGGSSRSKWEWLSIQHRKQPIEPKGSAATPSHAQSTAQITGAGTHNCTSAGVRTREIAGAGTRNLRAPAKGEKIG